MDTQRPKVSIIMRSKNSDWVIEEALEGLFAQNFKDFELIVVDSASTDRTLEIVGNYPCKLIEIEAKAYYPGIVLNMAIEQAGADIVVFQNSDTIPLHPEALENLVAPFSDPSVQATYARQTPRLEAQTWVRRDYASSFPKTGGSPPWITLSLPFAAMRKSIWEQHPFYTDAYASEDTEWGNWARTNGHIIRYVPDAVVRHSHNYTLRQLYGRRFVEGEADAFIFRNADSLPKMIKRFVQSTLRDCAAYCKALDIFRIPYIPIRRIVYHWAYLKGHKLGEQRIATGDKNASAGQEITLTRHDE